MLGKLRESLLACGTKGQVSDPEQTTISYTSVREVFHDVAQRELDELAQAINDTQRTIADKILQRNRPNMALNDPLSRSRRYGLGLEIDELGRRLPLIRSQFAKVIDLLGPDAVKYGVVIPEVPRTLRFE